MQVVIPIIYKESKRLLKVFMPHIEDFYLFRAQSYKKISTFAQTFTIK